MDQLERLKARVPAAAGQLADDTPVSSSRGDALAGPEPVMSADEAVREGRARVSAVLDAIEATYIVDGGDIYGIWDNGLFYFNFLGEDETEQIYQISGTWERILPEADHASAVMFANQWNLEHAWPRAQARLDEEDNSVVIGCDMTADFAGSLGDGQLDNFIRTALSTSLSLFDAAEGQFPHARLIDESPARPND